MRLNRKSYILAKKEVVYGTFPEMAAADALEVSDLNVIPYEQEMAQLDKIRPGLGNGGQVLVQKLARVSFSVDVAGHGALILGAVPAIDSILCGVALAGTQKYTAITSITRVGDLATATKNGHGLKVGDKVPVENADQEDYNGTQTISAVTENTFSFPVENEPVTPATGENIRYKSAYSYKPVSANMDSVAFAVHKDGVLHKLKGARGNLTIEANAKSVGKLRFEFTAVPVDPTDVANPVVDLSKFTVPQAVNFENTPLFTIHGFAAVLQSFSINVANEVIYRNYPNYAGVLITDRKPNGTVSFDAPLLAAKDFYAPAIAQTQAPLELLHGTKNGNKVRVKAPYVTLSPPQYGDAEGVVSLTTNVMLMASDAQNDELEISFE